MATPQEQVRQSHGQYAIISTEMVEIARSLFFTTHQRGRSANEAKAHRTKVPGLVRLLLILTTSPWRPDAIVYPEVADSIQLLRSAGWMIRTAYGRNFLLWRYGRIQYDTRLPVLVLPRLSAVLDRNEANALVAAELLRAELRVAGVRLNPPEFAEALETNFPGIRIRSYLRAGARLSDLQMSAAKKIAQIL